MANNHKKNLVQTQRHSVIQIVGGGFFSGTNGTGSIQPFNTYLTWNNAISSAGPSVANVGYSFTGSPNQAGVIPVFSSTAGPYSITGTYGAANAPGNYVLQFNDSYAGLISFVAQIHGRNDMGIVVSRYSLGSSKL